MTITISIQDFATIIMFGQLIISLCNLRYNKKKNKSKHNKRAGG